MFFVELSYTTNFKSICVDKEEYRLGSLQRAAGRWDAVAGFSGKSPLSSPAEELLQVYVSPTGKCPLPHCLLASFVLTGARGCMLQQGEWYRRSFQLLSLRGKSCFFVL